MILRSAFVCLASLLWIAPLLLAAKPTVQVAVIPLDSGEPGGSLVTSLIENALSEESGVVLLDRAEIDAILRERQIAPRDWNVFNELLPADVLAFVDIATASHGENTSAPQLSNVAVRIRLVDPSTGILYFSGVETFDLTRPQIAAQAMREFAPNISTALFPADPASGNPPVLIAIPDILSENLARQWDWTAESLRVALEHRLSATPGFIVLERQQARELWEETAFFHSEKATILASAFSISGTSRIEGNDLVAHLLVRRQGNLVAEIAHRGPLSEIGKIAGELSARLLAQLNIAQPLPRLAPEEEADQLLKEAKLYKRFDPEKSAKLTQAAAALVPGRRDIQTIMVASDPDWFRRLAIAEWFLTQPLLPEGWDCGIPNFSRLLGATRDHQSPLIKAPDAVKEEYNRLVRDFFQRYHRKIDGQCPQVEQDLIRTAADFYDLLASDPEEEIRLSAWAFKESVDLYRSGQIKNSGSTLETAYETLNPIGFLARNVDNEPAKKQYLQLLTTLNADPDPLVRYLSHLATSEFHREADKIAAASAAKTAIQIAKDEIWSDIANSPYHFRSRIIYLRYRLNEESASTGEPALIAYALQEIYFKARTLGTTKPYEMLALAETTQQSLLAAGDPAAALAVIETQIANTKKSHLTYTSGASLVKSRERLLRDFPEIAAAAGIENATNPNEPVISAKPVFSAHDLLQAAKPNEVTSPPTFWSVHSWGEKPVLIFTLTAPGNKIRVGMAELDSKTHLPKRVSLLQTPLQPERSGPLSYGSFLVTGPLFASDSQYAYLGVSGAGVVVFPSDGKEPFLADESSGLPTTTFRQMTALNGRLYLLSGDRASGLLEYDVAKRAFRELISDRRLHSDMPLDGRPLMAVASDPERNRLLIATGAHLLRPNRGPRLGFHYYSPASGAIEPVLSEVLSKTVSAMDGEEHFVWMQQIGNDFLITAHPLIMKLNPATNAAEILVSRSSKFPAQWQTPDGWGYGRSWHAPGLLLRNHHHTISYLHPNNKKLYPLLAPSPRPRGNNRTTALRDASSHRGHLLAVSPDTLYHITVAPNGK